jgi:phosphatidate cytidylyltransferase
MLKARLVTALCLIAGFLAVLFLFSDDWAACAFALIAVVAAWEWAGLMRASRIERRFLAGFTLVGCFSLWSRFHPAAEAVWMIAAMFWLFAAPFWLWRGWRLADRRWLGLGLGFLLITATWGALVGLHARSPLLLLAMMALVWVADSAAYFVGRAFGRHKLAPTISPGKTWEGVAGAVVGVLLYGFSLRHAFEEIREVSGVSLLAILVLLTAASIVGDLFESLAKRQVGMKDSGTVLPGHGGVLDRIDSLLPTLPLAALLLAVLG